MDPNKALKEIRRLIDYASDGTNSDAYEAAVYLYEEFIVFDEWLKNGGELPDDWKQKIKHE